MNPFHANELLERAAASVTPAETNPTSRLVSLGRRSVRRRRYAWGTAGSVAVAAVVAAVVAMPVGTALPDRSDSAAASGTTVSLGGLSVAVPKGWRTSNVSTFNPCVAEPRTLYLATRWNPSTRTTTCVPKDGEWLAIVQKGAALRVNPSGLVVKDKQVLQVEQPSHVLPSVRSYRAFSTEIDATAALISGDERGRERLLKRITWPAGPTAPASGGLALPDRITSALTDAPPSNGMVVARDARTLARIRTALAGLRHPVPAGDECTLQKPGSVGILLDDVIVVLGNARCPQAVSSGGGRVRAPATLGQELLNLIVASDRAATEQSTGD